MPFLPDLRIETTMCSSIENIYVVYLCTIVTKGCDTGVWQRKRKERSLFCTGAHVAVAAGIQPTKTIICFGVCSVLNQQVTKTLTMRALWHSVLPLKKQQRMRE